MTQSLTSIEVCPLVDVSLVELTRGLYAIVDTADLWIVKQYTWYANVKNNGPYAASRTGGQHNYLHRVLLDNPGDMIVDHINGNTLDNRRCNLRIVTKAENNGNRHFA
jgi:hypothetical protein